MAIGIKVFPMGLGQKSMQEQIDEWLQKEKPKNIIDMTASESATQREIDASPNFGGVLVIAYEK